MKSEIRDSTIRDLLAKVQKGSFSQYIRAIRLERIRTFSGATISFDFPVTALIGPNGSGKSTILNAAACAYSSIVPQNVFKKSRIGDDSMDNWFVEYDLIDKSINPRGSYRVSLNFLNNQWTRSQFVHRFVKLCSLNRTVPATDNPLFSFKKKLSVHTAEDSITVTNVEVSRIRQY